METQCLTCEMLRTEAARLNKTIAQRHTLGALLDAHFRSRHPELLRLGEPEAPGSVTPEGGWLPSATPSRVIRSERGRPGSDMEVG